MRLYLLRHAKSSWDDPSLTDHDRPLARRGRRAAKAMAAHLARHDIVPELVLCSTAVRTRQTSEAVLAGAPVLYERELYEARAADLLDRVRRVPDSIGSVLLIGHNPGTEELALWLSRPSPERDEVAVKFPTGALATLELDGASWSGLVPGRASLTAFVRPRDLQD